MLLGTKLEMVLQYQYCYYERCMCVWECSGIIPENPLKHMDTPKTFQRHMYYYYYFIMIATKSIKIFD